MILFHEKLKYLREHQELSQKEICKRLGLPTSTYCRYESGETQPNLTTLKLIANFFDVTVDYLLDNQVLTDNELGSVGKLKVNSSRGKQNKIEKTNS